MHKVIAKNIVAYREENGVFTDRAQLKKVSKKGKKFYGCSAYPKCDFAAPGVPTGDVCPECGGYIILGLRNRKYCMNADCPSKQTAKTKKEK